MVDYQSTGSGTDPEWPRAGTRVAVALPKMGAYSEYVALPAWLLVPVPEGLDPTVVVAIPLDYLHIGGANLRKGYRPLAPGSVLVSYAFAGRPEHMVADTVRGATQVPRGRRTCFG